MSVPSPLLAAGEPAPYRVLNPQAPSPLLLLCDHASPALPAAVGDLGVPPAERLRHIGWDIGAADVTERLARRFDACALFTTYSRLLIDCNRAPGDASSIPPYSDGTPVPGNTGLSDAEVDARIEAVFWPYHHAIMQAVAARQHRGQVPVLVAVHSFTPRMNGHDRPWQLGVLWNHDPRLALPLLEALSARGLCVGDNQPYSGRETGYTVEAHGAAAGLPHVVLEIRQDLIGDAEGCAHWAGVIGDALQPLLERPELARVEHF